MRGRGNPETAVKQPEWRTGPGLTCSSPVLEPQRGICLHHLVVVSCNYRLFLDLAPCWVGHQGAAGKEGNW